MVNAEDDEDGANADLKSLWSKPAARFKSSPSARPPKVAHQVHVLIIMMKIIMMMMILMMMLLKMDDKDSNDEDVRKTSFIIKVGKMSSAFEDNLGPV